MPALGDAPITAAVLGQGSIGRRHARLLLAEGCDVVAWDPAPAESVDAVRMVGTPDEALSAADVAVVASPSVRHLEQLAMALDHGCHVLVEKPAATSAAGIADLQTAATDADLVVAVAMNLRFHPGPSTVRELIAGGAIGRPLTAHVAFGSFLPSWRPGTDYRTGYSARAELGGGVLLDAIHELDYLTWVLGPGGRRRCAPRSRVRPGSRRGGHRNDDDSARERRHQRRDPRLPGPELPPRVPDRRVRGDRGVVVVAGVGQRAWSV